MTGRVKAVQSRGFGFIETEQGIDYFFHYSKYDGDWRKLVGDFVKAEESKSPIMVSFDNDPTSDDGPRAINVRRLLNGSERTSS